MLKRHGTAIGRAQGECPMWKPLAAGMIVLVIVGSTFVYAQQRPGGSFEHWRPSAEDVAVFADARIAALKAVLKLTSAQERHWPAVEGAMRELFRNRYERMSALRERTRHDDFLDRLRRRTDVMASTAAGLKKFIDAAEPLSQSLDETQRERVRSMIRTLLARHMMFTEALRDDGPGRPW
jgi:zinc resistance-associated protein